MIIHVILTSHIYIYKVFYNSEIFWIKHGLPRAEARVDD
jgi:hypothetical protein